MSSRSPTPSSDPIVAGTIVVVGGGCYGTFYAGQLAEAEARGRLRYDRLLVIDRDPGCRAARELGSDAKRQLVVEDWGAFFDRFLPDSDDAGDWIVPSPLMPHLMFEWLLRRARARWPGRPIEVRPVPAEVGTPYDTAAPDGTRFVSYADWLCPTHCIEPATCPVTRAPRTWEIGEALTALTRRLNRRRATAGPVLFACRHRVHGVGAFPAAEVRAGDALVERAGAAVGAVDVVVGTVSACHGAVNLLHLGRN